MKDVSEVFWNATIDELMKGYVYDVGNEEYICLVCGDSFKNGIIYTDGTTMYEAEKFTVLHIEKEHSSMFEYLLGLDKKLTGLTDHQKMLMELFYNGYSDNDIAKQLGGSASTIRNHRFTFREKEKQAKIFITIMKLLEKNQKKKKEFITMHRTATMVDERYVITEEENEKILKQYFTNGLNGTLSIFPAKEKRKIIILKYIIKKFDVNKKYTEKEVNEKLKEIYHDFVTIRRYLIEYGFMDREKDGSLYWVKV